MIKPWMYPPPIPLAGPPDRLSLCWIVSGVRQVVWMYARTIGMMQFVFWVDRRLTRTARRLEVLLGLWRAGKLPKPRVRRPRAVDAPPRVAKPPRPGLVPFVPFPRDAGWLVRRTEYPMSAYNGYFRDKLYDPEMAEFLAACPQAARLLRPMCHMLGTTPPPALELPPRPRRPRPSRARRASPPAAAAASPTPVPTPAPTPAASSPAAAPAPVLPRPTPASPPLDPRAVMRLAPPAVPTRPPCVRYNIPGHAFREI